MLPKIINKKGILNVGEKLNLFMILQNQKF